MAVDLWTQIMGGRLGSGGMVAIKHLLTKEEDDASARVSMAAIYNVLIDAPEFADFEYLQYFDDDSLTHDDANALLDRMYDYADANRILIK